MQDCITSPSEASTCIPPKSSQVLLETVDTSSPVRCLSCCFEVCRMQGRFPGPGLLSWSNVELQNPWSWVQTKAELLLFHMRSVAPILGSPLMCVRCEVSDLHLQISTVSTSFVKNYGCSISNLHLHISASSQTLFTK